jgi:hypothetical protein
MKTKKCFMKDTFHDFGMFYSPYLCILVAYRKYNDIVNLTPHFSYLT